MQEIREMYEDNGVIRELRDRLVGRESPELAKQFDERRAAALKRAEELGRQIEIHESRRIGRNDPCPCNSGKKFKKCCGRNLATDDTRVK